MTDTEMAKAVADACGIAVTADDGYPTWWTDDGKFWRPTECWNDAMHAAERFGLFTKNYATVLKCAFGWHVAFRIYPNGNNVSKSYGITNDCGPRAICEAILAIKKGTT